MSENGTLKLLAISDIHYGNDYTYLQKMGVLAGQNCTLRGSWGNAVMPMVINEFHRGKYDLLLEMGDRISSNKSVDESGKLTIWAYEMHTHLAMAGIGRVLDAKGNHCSEVGQKLGFPGIFMGYPYRGKNEDYPSSYRDVNGFRIVMSNAGTRQLATKGRFIPTEHMHWMNSVIKYSPYPVIVMQHVPPDEFDNGQDFYEKLAMMEMVMMVIHGHRHDPTTMEFPEGIPVLHMQALLLEDTPPTPGGHVAEIAITPDEITVKARALLGVCGNERTYRIDRSTLSLKDEPKFEGCPPENRPVVAAPTPEQA